MEPVPPRSDGRIQAASLAILWKIREAFPGHDKEIEGLRQEIVRLLTEQIGCDECIDGWVAGDHAIERCDTCTRFEDDDQARDHVANLIRTLVADYGPDEPLDVVVSLALAEETPDD